MLNYFDVIKAQSGIPVDDIWAQLWGTAISDKYTVIKYTGTLPITINANGEPLIDYRVYGNTEQTGTPTPENPIMPEGVGERTENLWNFTTQPLSGIGYLYHGNINLPAGTYTLRADLISNNVNMSFAVVNSQGNTVINTNVFNHNSRTFTSDYNMTQLRFYVDGTVDELYLTLTEGSTALPYEPYGYKLPILSNSTVTNIYLGEVQTTRRIKKLALTGEEKWNNVLGSGTQSRTYISLKSASIGMCTHYVSGDALNPGEFDLAGGIYLRFNVSGVATTRTEWINYLAAQYAAGTPVTVWYVLEEPETAVVNEPLMKIGDHADTLSMEQAGVSIPTNNGSTVIDYNGTLKPSQMYIKYKARR